MQDDEGLAQWMRFAHPLRFMDWAAEYYADRRLATDRDKLAEVVRPLRQAIDRDGRIPQWAGPDLLRGLAFLIWDEYERDTEDLAPKEAQMALDAANRQLEPIAWAVSRHPRATANERFQEHRLLKWVNTRIWWVAEVGDGSDMSEFGDGTRYRIFDDGKRFQLWVWAGPPENTAVLGMMGADLRGQNRAKHLSTHATVGAAKRAADRDLKKAPRRQV